MCSDFSGLTPETDAPGNRREPYRGHAGPRAAGFERGGIFFRLSSSKHHVIY